MKESQVMAGLALLVFACLAVLRASQEGRYDALIILFALTLPVIILEIWRMTEGWRFRRAMRRK